MLAFMNHFPLFAVMLRLKDPARLPGGVQFQLLKLRSGVPYLKMTVSFVLFTASNRKENFIDSIFFLSHRIILYILLEFSFNIYSYLED